MRIITAIPSCFALLYAFLVSPFQHVHPGGEHDHTATIHAHFYSLPTPDQRTTGVQLEAADDDDHDAVWSVDSFTLAPATALTVSPPAPTIVELFAPPVPVAWVDVVEQRGHDPPREFAFLIPRAPPS
jgi:hypothetical protein